MDNVHILLFQTCSMEVNCETLAVMGATLANGGVCPTTAEVSLNPEAVRDVLSLMHSCGMYNYSGQFAFNVSFFYLEYSINTVRPSYFQPTPKFPLTFLLLGFSYL